MNNDFKSKKPKIISDSIIISKSELEKIKKENEELKEELKDANETADELFVENMNIKEDLQTAEEELLYLKNEYIGYNNNLSNMQILINNIDYKVNNYDDFIFDTDEDLTDEIQSLKEKLKNVQENQDKSLNFTLNKLIEKVIISSIDSQKENIKSPENISNKCKILFKDIKSPVNLSSPKSSILNILSPETFKMITKENDEYEYINSLSIDELNNMPSTSTEIYNSSISKI